MTSKTKVLVIGASPNPDRYSNVAMRLLKRHGFDVLAIGNKVASVEGLNIAVDPPMQTDIHTVTLYIRPELQQKYYEYVLALKPVRVIFNPGTENSEFADLLKKESISVTAHCTLVMLDSGTF
ncbi:MAG: CoA-binding protein [Bacteroidetes bacterium]|nr:CoA-binding protein [Bacteroidota bacterium]